jgi:hypothetical protein
VTSLLFLARRLPNPALPPRPSYARNIPPLKHLAVASHISSLRSDDIC